MSRSSSAARGVKFSAQASTLEADPWPSRLSRAGSAVALSPALEEELLDLLAELVVEDLRAFPASPDGPPGGNHRDTPGGSR